MYNFFIFFLLFISLVHETNASVSKERFRHVIGVVHRKFSFLSTENNRKLKFFTNYESDWAQAFARRWEADEIHLYGGFAKIKDASEDSLALIICHELGHFHGGFPYSNSDLKLSVEGRSDYWATEKCLTQVLPFLSEKKPTDEALLYCENDVLCARSVNASEVITTHFALNARETKPQINIKDPTEVTQILKTHPSAQCRLDTLLAGLRKENFPKCWMP